MPYSALMDEPFPFPLVTLSDQERHAGKFSADRFRSAALALHTHGYVILKQAVCETLVSEAASEFESILLDCQRSREGESWYQSSAAYGAVFWERNSRWRIFPKLRGVMSDPALVANPFARQLLEFYLGDDFYCKFVSSDTCLKGARLQAPHRELGAGEFWRPDSYVVNIPLCRCTLENGPLEVWPGSGHLWRNDVLRQLGFSTEAQDEAANPEFMSFAEMLPSCKLTIGLGDVLIRDPGLMHRGTVNQTDTPRSLLTVCYFRQGKDHDYGRWEYNLDEASYQQLPGELKQLFPRARAEFESTTRSDCSPDGKSGAASSSGRNSWSRLVARIFS